ncbi:MAG TPA: adenylate/guanylate cyclase domain-containing protein [Oligoflexus sp.]|uniref:adenylate/guanylate cyclase domain-containing protein n=1 Tax=Oligoflexus sp. TaxID=1971216 RepID=UPI002D3B4A4D|nr:adenylate/guanylate cyclase domain-containing protein [Oligoflexus sp.]HYX33950.1 adenylate/guanylate cyclase domain-containing protein [Oligoflexus sp.]
MKPKKLKGTRPGLRFLPHSVVEKLAQREGSLDEEPKQLNCTIMFCDLVNFVAQTYTLKAEKMGQILNLYFQTMTDIVFEEGGTIDKFMGDGICIIFGAPEPMPAEEQASRAARAAIRMLEALDELNRIWTQQSLPAFEMRIGIDRGDVVVGWFGAKTRKDFTAIGVSVNIASRLQSQCRPGTILVTEPMARTLPSGSASSIGLSHIRGGDHQVELFELRKALAVAL